MGYPTGGVIMGTRPGDFDSTIPLTLVKQYGYTVDEVMTMINKEYGIGFNGN